MTLAGSTSQNKLKSPYFCIKTTQYVTLGPSTSQIFLKSLQVIIFSLNLRSVMPSAGPGAPPLDPAGGKPPDPQQSLQKYKFIAV